MAGTLEASAGAATSLSRSELERYRRHLALSEIGVAGQEKLKAARVLIVGAGGLGSPAALYLAAAGCGTLGLLDGDRVDLTNLQRQVLFDSESLGQLKAEAGRERLAALNPEVRITAHALELRAANVRALFTQYDLVLDGTDRLSTRYLINDACVILRRPLVSAAIHRFEGHLITYVPGRGPCYRCLFPLAMDGMVANCAEHPGLGMLQATEAIKLITGVGEPLIGRLLTYDALAMRFSEFRVAHRGDCAVCGAAPTITEPRDMPSTPVPEGIRRLTAAALQELLARGERPLLVDVREDVEFDAGHLPGALHIPLGQLPQRLAEIDPQAQPVFICRSGGRSMTACQIALRANIRAPANLEGGMLAWASSIDPSIRVV